MRQAYRETGTLETRYGRRFRAGQTEGEAVTHLIFGTVEDIVSVAMVTFWTNRTTRDIMILRAEGGPSADTIRIHGTGPSSIGGKASWMIHLQELATLASPLGLVDLKTTLI